MTPLEPTVTEQTSNFLASLGFSEAFLDQLSEGAKDEARAKALAWVNGMVSSRGRDRGKAVRDCGRLFPALLPSGKVVILARPCKDRACPRCMVARATKLGNQLRAACEVKAKSGAGLCFVTLTQKKAHASSEGPGEAIARLMTSWARLTRSSSRKRNARLRAMMVGGVRGIECVWSGKGSEVFTPRAKGQDLTEWKETRKVSHVVRYSGWHAHMHCVIELAHPGRQLGEPIEELEHELREVWRWASKRSDPEQGVDVQEVQSRNVGQVAKYCTKPFELPEARARELFSAIHSRRLLDGFGGWRGWRSWAPEEDSPYAGASLASVSLASLAYRHRTYEARGRGAKTPERIASKIEGVTMPAPVDSPEHGPRAAAPVSFKQWRQCGETGSMSETTVAVLSLDQVHERLKIQAGEANFAAVARWSEKTEAKSDAHESSEARALARSLAD